MAAWSTIPRFYKLRVGWGIPRRTKIARPDSFIYQQALRAWRPAQASVEDWPRITVLVPDRHNKWTLGWDTFPVSFRQDFEAWRDRLAGRDFLDEMPFRPVRNSTLACREWQVRAFASALVHRGRDPATI